MKTIFIFILICMLHIDLFAQSNILYQVTDPKVAQWELGDSVGYADANGNMVIPFGKYRCCYSEEFDKIAFVSFFNRQGVYAIDRNENVLFEVFISDNWPDLIHENTFRIKSNEKIGFADVNGNVIISPQFDVAFPFEEGFAGVCIGGTKQRDGDYTLQVGGKWKFINKNNVPINNEEYDDLRSFGDGKALVMKDGKWGKIDRNGVVVVPIKYTFYEAGR